MNIGVLRSYFPHLQHRTYVNHAAVSPLSDPVREAVEGYLDERQGCGPNDPVANFESFRSRMVRAKERMSGLLGTSESRIEFVPNTSSGLNLLTLGFEWERGDRIAVPDGSFPTNVYPFLNLERQGVSVDFVPTSEGAFTLAGIENTIRDETRLLSVSWVHFLSGFRADLEAIGRLCRKHNVYFCVDAIQGLGAIELDVDDADIDFLSAGGHKWLMAPQGVGVIYCSEELQKELVPPTGWLHGPVDWDHLDRYELTYHPDARRFRTGSLNALGIVALDAALGLYLEAGPKWCEQRVIELAEILRDELDDRGFRRYGDYDRTHTSGITTIAPDKPEELFNHLQENGINTALRNRKLRFSPTYYNTEADVSTVLDVVDSFPG